MNGRVLITGGAGFIGLHLARCLLAADYKVTLVDNHARGIRDQDFEELISAPAVSFSEVDLLNLDSVCALGSNFCAIFHLAAIIGVSHVTKRPYEVLVQNTRMLDNVLTLARDQRDFSRFLFASTSEVYAGTLQYFGMPIPTPENTPLAMAALDQPRTSYMISKIMGEAMCQQSGLPFTIFRPHNVYGPRMGMAHVIPEQLRKAWESSPGDTVPVYSVDHRRTFCFIDDAVEMLKRMLEVDSVKGMVLNLGVSFPEVTIGELARICFQVVGKQLEIRSLAPTTGSPERRAPDMSTVARLLNYESKVSLKDGVERTWTWYRNNIFEGGGSTAR